MQGVNKTILMGYLGADPKTSEVGDDKVVCNFRLGITKKYKSSSSDELKEDTQWHNIVVWGNQAKSCGKYLKKGSPVYIEGEISADKEPWEDQDGVQRIGYKIQAISVNFLDNKKSTEEKAA